MPRWLPLVATVCLTVLPVSPLQAEDFNLENVTAPSANDSKEELASEFSMETAVHFLDQAALDWTKSRKCFTCHTNYAYLMARPAVSSNVTAHHQIRAELEQLVEHRWESAGPRWDAEVVMAAAVLAMNDSATTRHLHATTKKALDRMWSVQREDGGIDWLKCGWPPMESDDDYGVAMIALATGVAPDNYQNSPAAVAGIEKLKTYLASHPAPTIHHQAMLLWANCYLPGLLTAEQRNATIEQLLALQKTDGGWNSATLGNWERSDGHDQDTNTSDGYGTGFVITVLRQADIPADHIQLQRGIEWLKANQRVSGRWYTRSLNKDNKHYLSHAGSAFAVMAIAACEPVRTKNRNHVR